MTNRIKTGLLASVTLAMAPASAVASPGQVPAAVGYINGHVYTANGWVTSVGTAGDKVVAVGSNETVKAALPADAQIVDLAGRTVFPGLFDLHIHPISAGRGLTACNFPETAGVDQMVAAVAECVKKAKPGSWIYGAGWSMSSPVVKQFDKKLLDRVSPDNPVMLSDTTGHHGWANSKALAAAGFSKDSPEVDGGKIVRDASGEPTGLLLEAPATRLRYDMPTSSVEEAAELLGSALDVLASYGITSVTDAAVKMDEVRGYDALADAGRLKQQVRGCILWKSDTGQPNADFSDIYANRASYNRAGLRFDCVKVFMDGVPNESRTAAMIDPYVTEPGGHVTSGSLVIDVPTLNRMMGTWDKDGMTVKFHVGGDLAARDALNVVEAARVANGNNGPLHEVVHNTFTTPTDLARAKRLNVALEFSPVYWYPNPLAVSIAAAQGPIRAKRTWPVREAINAGAVVYSASDWPAVEAPNPWLAIETLVTRQAPGGSKKVFAGREAVSLKQAIDMYTRNPAIAFDRPGDNGTIHVGGPADLVVLDNDPFAIPITKVHNIRALRTVAAGKVIFDNGVIKP